MIALKELFGKLHPLILHLPIGILFYAYVKYAYDLFVKKSDQPDIRFALILGGLSAVLASCSGWVLAGSGEFSGQVLTNHKWLGIGTSAFIIALIILQARFSARRFFVLFSVLMGLLTATGHFGGTLTHGDDYLAIDSEMQKSYDAHNLESANVFEDLVLSIVNEKCVSCHNDNKAKGGLKLTTKDNWRKGGDTGPVITMRNAEASLISTRINLHKTHEQHMPPKGKQQLTREEIDFIDWWVANMTTYDEELNALNPTGEVMDLVQEIFVKEEYDVSPADPLLVESLRSRGVKLSSMGTDVPWLAASLRNSGNLKASFKDLLKVKDQIYELDLAGAGITSKEIKYVNSFENLQSLSLANAAITTEDFTKVKPRESMRSINVVGTKIDQTAYEHFKKFTSLEKIFVWNSSIEQEIVDKWKKEMPQWRIVSGADLSIFKSVKLEAPIIAVEKDIFTDSILVSLITQAPKSQVFYTLDGSPPDSSSFEYQAPFYVFKSSQVKAIVRKSDWEDSAPSAQTIMRAKYEAKNVVLKEPPAERYQGKGPKSLIDLEKGSEDFTDGQWLGFQGKHIEAIVTLDSLVELNSVTLSFQQDYVSYIYYPSGITVRTSPDGEIYGNPVNYDIPLLEAPEGKRLENFLVRLPTVEAQYVKIFLTSRLKNPDWHPAPGAPSWVFIDEILVE